MALIGSAPPAFERTSKHLAERMRYHRRQGRLLPVLLTLEARPDAVVHSAACGLFVGLESLSQENLSHWTKGPNRAEEYVGQVRKLHENGIAVYAGFVFGSDGDSPDVFQRTLDFLDEAKVDALQATRLTPFPGTPLFEEMDQAGRIFDKDWSHYDFGHVVFEPVHMSRETLDLGVAWISREFYSRRRVAVRLARQVGYLAPSSIVRGTIPLNLGYRVRFARNGTLDKGTRFKPATGARRHLNYVEVT